MTISFPKINVHDFFWLPNSGKSVLLILLPKDRVPLSAKAGRWMAGPGSQSGRGSPFAVTAEW